MFKEPLGCGCQNHEPGAFHLLLPGESTTDVAEEHGLSNAELVRRNPGRSVVYAGGVPHFSRLVEGEAIHLGEVAPSWSSKEKPPSFYFLLGLLVGGAAVWGFQELDRYGWRR